MKSNKQYAVRLTEESERALKWLRKRPGGFNLSKFIQQQIMEYAESQNIIVYVKQEEKK